MLTWLAIATLPAVLQPARNPRPATTPPRHLVGRATRGGGSVDHVVGEREQCRRHFEPIKSRRLQNPKHQQHAAPQQDQAQCEQGEQHEIFPGLLHKVSRPTPALATLDLALALGELGSPGVRVPSAQFGEPSRAVGDQVDAAAHLALKVGQIDLIGGDIRVADALHIAELDELLQPTQHGEPR